MKTLFVPALALALLVPVAADANGQRRSDQSDAREQMMAGKVKSLRDIESRVIPRMRGMEYLGPEYDAAMQIYRLKFINKGKVVFVDVDATTGAILRQR